MPNTEEYVTTIYDFISNYFFISMLVISVILIFNAIYGYKIFKLAIIATSTIGLGLLGHELIGSLILKLFEAPPEKINVPAICGIAFALIGAALAIWVHKLMLFVNGAAFGFAAGIIACYFLGWSVPFFADRVASIIISAIVAVIVGVLFIFIFKPVYIVISSVAGMTLAGFIISVLIAPGIYVILSIILSAVGFIAGIAAAVYQFKSNSSYYFY